MPYVIPPQPALVLRHIGGHTRSFASRQAAFKALGYHWILENVGREFYVREPYTPPGYFVYSERPPEWILEQSNGLRLTVQDFTTLWCEVLARRRMARWKNYPGYGPVPGTGRRRYGKYFRSLRHMNERRAAALVVTEDGEVAPRPNRGVSLLPNPWDDYTIAARRDRNWKRFRKTQWKPKG